MGIASTHSMLYLTGKYLQRILQDDLGQASHTCARLGSFWACRVYSNIHLYTVKYHKGPMPPVNFHGSPEKQTNRK